MKKIHKSFWCTHGSDEKPSHPINCFGAYFCEECWEFGGAKLFTYCEICDKHWHVDCVPNSPDDINHPYHSYHPLKLLIDVSPDYSNGKCDACQEKICQEKLTNFFYNCSMCDYNMHVRCAKNPLPLVVDAPRCHEHILKRMARNDRFTCNACGTYGEECPYVCAPCSLMFHKDCINLPHVININLHEDRISHTYSLGFGDKNCMICQKMIDWRYGAYSCTKCPSYVVHFKCATRDDVWDGVELEDVPDEFFDVSPFKVIEDGIINHFSHQEHNLRIVDDGIELDKSLRCEACTHPIFSERHYRCMKCNYTLHETCASLPLQKRHGLSRTPFTLINKDENRNFFMCRACNSVSNGFSYKSGDIELDVRCATMSFYCDYDCHRHTIFLTTTDYGSCGNCQKDGVYVLNCVECDYSMCFKCATLPKKIKHRCDDHFLSLRFGEKAEGKYWCEVCETVVDSQSWFYTCDDCGVVCHIECVLGEFLNAKPGVMDINDTRIIVLTSNDSMSRPKCRVCRSRCQLPLIIKDSDSGRENVFCKSRCQQNNR